MLRSWLETPQVVAWWGNADEQYALLDEDLANPLMTMLIVEVDRQPFAYAQHYDVGSWPQPHFADLPPGSRAIDAFVGEPDLLGVGHGGRFLRLLAERLLAAGAPRVAIDPDVDNPRARRAYARAGFREIGVRETGEGPAMVMVFEPAVEAS